MKANRHTSTASPIRCPSSNKSGALSRLTQPLPMFSWDTVKFGSDEKDTPLIRMFGDRRLLKQSRLSRLYLCFRGMNSDKKETPFILKFGAIKEGGALSRLTRLFLWEIVSFVLDEKDTPFIRRLIKKEVWQF